MKVRVSTADSCEKVRCFYNNFLDPTQPLSYMLLDFLTSKIAYFLPKKVLEKPISIKVKVALAEMGMDVQH